ncbi:uncharacterized protein LOC121246291 [Juglans microcarpa x Juglans regia]|uniref:uncharacterized protein LOC121246291 n=1 Tax=Juglans microcarpa x Juglans regia TaxID=2249226 RepID=UPI001B7E9B1B|nr:uncharacterized protein LOC121246291 [Juglans microcarpa x Juglans regia]
MAINCGAERWEHSKSEQDQVAEEDEDLSFCDLPVISYLTKDQDNQSREEEDDDAALDTDETQEEFDFSSRRGSLLKESEMCSADEVFFQGRILPLRLSVSSDAGSTGFRHESQKTSGRCISRSESLEHGSMGGFTSNSSSRSSSTRSRNSSSSTASSTNYTIKTRTSKQRVQNHFLTCPSPKPQIRFSTTKQGNQVTRSRNSSTWDYLRLGLVPTPEIGLQDLKLRRNSSVNKNSDIRNSSTLSSSRNSVVTSKNSAKNNIISGSRGEKSPRNPTKVEKQRRTPGFLEKRIGGLLNGCKCTDEAVSSNVVIIRSSNVASTYSESATHAKKEKLVLELKIKKNQEEKQLGKQAMSRHRTFEWLKELSHAELSP